MNIRLTIFLNVISLQMVKGIEGLLQMRDNIEGGTITLLRIHIHPIADTCMERGVGGRDGGITGEALGRHCRNHHRRSIVKTVTRTGGTELEALQ